jgi:hypothetical protein
MIISSVENIEKKEREKKKQNERLRSKKLAQWRSNTMNTYF